MPSIVSDKQLEQYLADLIRQHTGDQGKSMINMNSNADIGGMEDQAAAQEKLGLALPGMSQAGTRNDWGSNLGRAGAGIASSMQNYQAQKLREQASQSRKAAMAMAIEKQRQEKLPNANTASGDYYDEP